MSSSPTSLLRPPMLPEQAPPPPPHAAGDPLVCGPGNVCIVPASRIQQRLAEKKAPQRTPQARRSRSHGQGDAPAPQGRQQAQRVLESRQPTQQPNHRKGKDHPQLGPRRKGAASQARDRARDSRREGPRKAVGARQCPAHTYSPSSAQGGVLRYTCACFTHRRRRRGEHRRARDPTHARAASSRSHRGDQEGDPAAQVVQAAEPRHGCGHTHRGGGREGRDCVDGAVFWAGT